MTEACSILIVDSDRRSGAGLAAILKGHGCRIRTCGSRDEAIELLGKHAFDIVLLDNVKKTFDPEELPAIIENILPEKKENGRLLLNEKSRFPGNVSDITERKRYEEKLEESEAIIRGIFDLSPLPISVSELETGRFVDVNDELCRFTKYTKEELVGKRSTEIGLFSGSDREKFMEALRPSGEVKGLEMDFKTKDGLLRSTLMFSKIIESDEKKYLITTFYDQTDRKRLEAQTQLIQRLETVATLSGGIAHQFNNALQNVVGNIELLGLELPGKEEVENFSERTRESTHRMAYLVNQLLAYARGGKYNSEVVHLSDFVRSILPAVIPDRSEKISMDTNLSEDISEIHADKSQLQMVLAAVLTNAIEAMEDKGRIVITSGNREIDEAFAARHPGLKDGSYAGLEIVDDGKGMDEKTISRIFEPFFTTKTKGRGLGLSAAYGIIKNHDGYIYVDSEPGKGTKVCILIPSG